MPSKFKDKYCISEHKRKCRTTGVQDKISHTALPRFSVLALTRLEMTPVWFICPSVSLADLPEVFCCCNSYGRCPSNIPRHLNPGGFKARHTSLSSYLLLSRRFTGRSGQSDVLKASSRQMCRRCTGARDIWPLQLFRASEGAPGPVLSGGESHRSSCDFINPLMATCFYSPCNRAWNRRGFKSTACIFALTASWDSISSRSELDQEAAAENRKSSRE